MDFSLIFPALKRSERLEDFLMILTVFSFNNNTLTPATTNPKLLLMPSTTSLVIKICISNLKEQGFPSQEVADRVGVHRATVDHVYNHLLRNLDFYHVEPDSSCPWKLSPEDRRFAALELAWGYIKTTVDLQCEFSPMFTLTQFATTSNNRVFLLTRGVEFPF